MSIEVTWLNEKQSAIKWHFHGRWTWIEYYSAMKFADDLVKDIPHPIDVVVDVSRSSLFPARIFSNIRADKTMSPEKLGRILIVGSQNMFIRSAVEILKRLNRSWAPKLFLFEELAQAEAFLATNPVEYSAVHKQSK